MLICVTFSLPPGVRGWLRLLLAALPGLFCLPFFKSVSHFITYITDLPCTRHWALYSNQLLYSNSGLGCTRSGWAPRVRSSWVVASEKFYSMTTESCSFIGNTNNHRQVCVYNETFYAPNFEEVAGAYWFRVVCPCVRLWKTVHARVLKFHIWIPHRKIAEPYLCLVRVISLSGVMPLWKNQNETLSARYLAKYLS